MANRGNWLSAAVLLTALAGCWDEKLQEAVSPNVGPAAELARDFDVAATGTLKGRIVWRGPIPSIPAFEIFPDLTGQPDLPKREACPNPHTPQVNEQNRGVAQAVVFLRQVELRRSRLWDHAPVLVEHSDWQFKVRQGTTAASIGFVRRGESFQTVSKQKVLHILHGDGAAFFSLPLPDPDVVTTRRLERTGHLDLASAADYFWMRAHLFVDDHPYYALSDANGQFVLPQVPAGSYQMVCWLPNWNVAWHERDAESGLKARVGYQPPLEKETSVTVTAGGTVVVDFAVAAKDFAR